MFGVWLSLVTDWPTHKVSCMIAKYDHLTSVFLHVLPFPFTNFALEGTVLAVEPYGFSDIGSLLVPKKLVESSKAANVCLNGVWSLF